MLTLRFWNCAFGVSPIFWAAMNARSMVGKKKARELVLVLLSSSVVWRVALMK